MQSVWNEHYVTQNDDSRQKEDLEMVPSVYPPNQKEQMPRKACIFTRERKLSEPWLSHLQLFQNFSCSYLGVSPILPLYDSLYTYTFYAEMQTKLS